MAMRRNEGAESAKAVLLLTASPIPAAFLVNRPGSYLRGQLSQLSGDGANIPTSNELLIAIREEITQIVGA